jgi:type IV secretory pathway TraG/TraD family ATPase VirD4
MYFLGFTALAAMCWAAPVDEDRWPRLSWWIRSAMYGAAVVALAMLVDALSPRAQAPTLGTAGVLWIGTTLIANILRNVWAWVAGHVSGLFGGGNDGHLRGARLVDGKTLQKILRDEDGDLHLGLQKFPKRLEPLHLLLSGGTGAGKSTALQELLDGVAARNSDRVFAADNGGALLQTYYSKSRGDVILNPLDGRAAPWSPLAEMAEPWDADRIAKSLIPDVEGEAGEWRKYAQVRVSAVLQYCFTRDLPNGELYRLLCVADDAELAAVCAGSGAARQFTPGAEKMSASIAAIVASFVEPLRYLDPQAGKNAFSLSKWVADDNAKAWAFFNYSDAQLALLRPLVACTADVVSMALLNLPTSRERAFWLILDEADSLGQINSLRDFLTKSRKYGGRAVLGLQTIAQLRERYGRDGAQVLLSCLSNVLCLRTPDPETADYLSRALGEQQVVRVLQSGGENQQGIMSGGGTSKSENWSQQVAQERIVMPSEIQNLPDLAGYLNLAGDIPTAPVRIPVLDRIRVADGFVRSTRPPYQPQPAQPAQAAPEPETLENDGLSI